MGYCQASVGSVEYELRFFLQESELTSAASSENYITFLRKWSYCKGNQLFADGLIHPPLSTVY